MPRWAAIDTVAFVSDGGAPVSSISGPDGSSITLPTDTYLGHTFNGWFTAPSGGTEVGGPGSSFIIPGGGITLYAQWTKPKLLINLWHTTNGAGYSAPVVSGGTLFVIVGSGALVALNARTGRTEWSTGNDLDAFVAPVVSRNIVFVIGTSTNINFSSTLYAFNARTGRELWSYDDEFEPFTLIAAGGNVYIGEFPTTVQALNARTGVPVWTYTLNHKASLGPIGIDDGVIYVGFNIDEAVGNDVFHRQLVALNATSGSLVWTNFGGYGVGPDGFVIRHGVLYAPGYYFLPNKFPADAPALFALNALTGSLIWLYPHDGSQFDGTVPVPTISDESVLVESGPYLSPQTLVALARGSGQVLWTDSSLGTLGGLTSRHGIVYASVNGNTLDAINPRTGSTYWTFASQSVPVFDRDVAYVEGDDGSIYALNATFGAIVARSPSGNFSRLTAADGVLYSLSGGNLYAFALPQHADR